MQTFNFISQNLYKKSNLQCDIYIEIIDTRFQNI